MNFQFRIGDKGKEEVHPIPLGISTIGRKRSFNDPRNEPEATFAIGARYVSWRHAHLECTEETCWITDNGRHGTEINGKRLNQGERVELRDGDEILIAGRQRFVFEKVPIAEPITPKEAPHVPIGPPTEPPCQFAPFVSAPRPEDETAPPGLSLYSQRLLYYLPEIYQIDWSIVTAVPSNNGLYGGQLSKVHNGTLSVEHLAYTNPATFLSRFLALFESISLPIEWTITNFDLFLDPRTMPDAFLPWMEQWFGLTIDETWTVPQRRMLLCVAQKLNAMRGTRWALRWVLAIYTGHLPEIDDEAPELPANTFRVRVHRAARAQRSSVEAIIQAYKPIHTHYILEFNE